MMSLMWRRAFEHMLRRIIRTGYLEVQMPDGSTRDFGDGTSEPVRITIRDSRAFRPLCVQPSLAVGECYMDQSLVIDRDDLTGFLELLMTNVEAVGNLRVPETAEPPPGDWGGALRSTTRPRDRAPMSSIITTCRMNSTNCSWKRTGNTAAPISRIRTML